MFEHLPIVSEATMQASLDGQEAEKIAKDINHLMMVLATTNKYLSTAVLMCTEVVAVNFQGQIKEAVKADTATALFVVLSLINKEIEKSATERRN